VGMTPGSSCIGWIDDLVRSPLHADQRLKPEPTSPPGV
jgi:hypothetical protein